MLRATFILRRLRSPFKISHFLTSFRAIKKHSRSLILGLGVVSLLILIIFCVLYTLKLNYQLSPLIASMIVKPDNLLVSKQLSFNQKSQSYTLNETGIGSAGKALPNRTAVGALPNAYSLKIPRFLNKGITYFDNASNLSFTLTPQFKTHTGKNNKGQFVYPLGSGNIQDVYTIKQNGLEEDIVVNKLSADTLTFSYKLNLPNDLVAKMLPSGAVGIYSADPSLFGNISYGSPSDQLLVQKAKVNSPKNHLVFALMAPSIAISGNRNTDSGKTKLYLKDSVMTLVASNLNKLHYPIVIDPSVIVASASTFGNTGNNESDLSLNPSTSQISVDGLTGGVLGSTWTVNATSLLTATTNLNTVAYNGYIYEVAGFDTAYTGNVSYAPINSNGSIGTWVPTSTIPTAYAYADTLAYNGYIYEIGGAQGNTTFANVYYALICTGTNTGILGCSSTPGSLGTWTPTTNLPVANGYATASAYNGYIYEIGGCGLVCGTASITTVDYIAINGDGSLASAWTATASLPTASHGAGVSAVVYNGFLYYIGGETGASTISASVFYSAIFTSGALGAWRSTTSLPIATAFATNVVSNGYLYVIGGNTGSATSTIDYASINSDGSLGAWIATTSLLVATYVAGSVVYNGYIYEVGGFTTANVATVNYIPIEPAGYIGSWPATTTLPATTSKGTSYYPINATSVAYNGYVYEIGGVVHGSAVTVVDYALINSDGTLGTWTAATNSLPTATDLATSVVYNGYLYEIGGFTTAVTAVVDYALICTATNSGVGGCTGIPGNLGTWTAATNSLPTATDQATSVVYNGYVYEIGGFTTAATAVVNYALINSNGNLGTWKSTTSLPVATYSATYFVYSGYVYEIGGTTSNGVVDYASLNNGGPGTIGTWVASTNTLPAATYAASSADYVLANNSQLAFFWEIGGYTTVPTSAVTYDRSTLATGNVTATASTTSLPTATYQATSAAYNGYVYEIGGNTGSSPTAAVYYNLICTGKNSGVGGCTSTAGTLGGPTWTTTANSLPVATDQATSVVYNGYLYEIGGYNGTSVVNTVYYAPLNADGTVGTWATTTSLPLARDQATSVVYNGYVYEIGGYNGTSVVNTVYYAPLNADGTVGTWAATNSLPVATDQATSGAYNGYIYEVGGFDGTSNLSTIYYAPINAVGTIDIWNTTTSLSVATDQASLITFNGYLFEFGGFTTAAIPDVNYVGLNSIPRIGIYSSLVDISGYSNSDPNPLKFESQGTNTGNQNGFVGIGGGGGITTQYQFASNACTTFNAKTALLTGISNPLNNPYSVAFLTDGCTNVTNLGRYLFVRYILDDSGTSSFPDVYGNHTSITNFNLWYHPDVKYRLRHGKTFSNNSLQSLDAPATQ
jgi:N-acetylneuraminic acid mutarotase